MSRSPSTELPKKDSSRKPVLGKFGNLFNSTKKKQSKGSPESPTSPANEKVATYRLTERERKRAQLLVASSSKAQNQSPVTSNVECASDQHSPRVPKEPSSPASQSLKVTSNGSSENGHSSESKNSSVKADEGSAIGEAESPVLSPDVLSDSTKSPLRPASRVDRQSTEKIVRQLILSPGRKSLTDEEGKTSVRRVSQEIHIVKNGSPKILTKKTTKFSSRATDPKIRISERSVQKLGSTEKLQFTKVSSPVTLGNDAKDQALLPAELNQCPDTVGGNGSISKSGSAGDSLSPLSPLEGDVFVEPLEDKSKEQKSSENAKVLAFDIYLTKTAITDSQPSVKSRSNSDPAEKSPTIRTMGKKRRSLKSQSSQEENKAENTTLQDHVFEESNLEGVRELSNTPDGDLKPMSPESNSPTSANQELKAGANNKVSPKGESDKDKQQHPASSPMRKKNSHVPSSPTDRKAHGRDPLYRNQAAAASARATELSQPVPVSTTKDAYVEKASVPVSIAGCGGEDPCNTTEEDSTATAVVGADRRTKQEGEQKVQAESDANQPSYSNAAKLHLSLNDGSKSTVTSKLSIPPKPKNVELPIKSKVAENVDEGIVEAIIPKGNIATKVSLFESKRTSHKQIDFYATKNISQQKKYVERAKLNFGKQVKGVVSKEFSSPAKQASNSTFSSGKKTENGQYEIKTDKKKDESRNNKAGEGSVVTPSSQMQMEDNRNGFGIEATDKLSEESILSSQKNVKNYKEPPSEQTSSADVLSKSNNSQPDGLQLDAKTEDALSKSPGSIEYLVEDSAGGVSHTDPPEMGNKQNSLKEPTFDAASNEDSSESLTKEHETLDSDDVDSLLPSKVQAKTDHLQSNDSKEKTKIKNEAQAPKSKRKVTGQSSEARVDPEETQPKEIVNDDTKGDVHMENTASFVSHEVNSDLLKEEITNDTKKQTTDTEDLQSNVEEIIEKSLLQENSDLLSSSTHQEKENPPMAESVVLAAVIPAGHEQPITDQQNHSIQILTKDAIETIDGLLESSNTDDSSLVGEDDVHLSSVSSQLESGESSVPDSVSPKYLKQENSEVSSSLTHHEKKGLPMAESLVLEAVIPAGQEQPIADQQNHLQSSTKDSIETNDGELKGSYTENSSPECENDIHKSSVSSHLESEECTDPISVSPKSLLQENSDVLTSVTRNEKESLPIVESIALEADISEGKEQSISDQKNHDLQISTKDAIRTNDGGELEGSYTENPSPECENDVQRSSVQSHVETRECSVPNSASPKSLLQENSDVLISVTDHEKESTPIVESFVLDAVIPAGKEQLISDQQNHLHGPRKDARNNHEVELEGSYTDSSSPKSKKAGLHQSSAGPHPKSGECSVPNSILPQPKLPEVSDKDVKEPTVFPDETVSPKPNTEILSDGTNDIVSCAESAKENGSTLGTNEQGDFRSTPNGSDTENNLEVQHVVETTEEMSENLKDVEAQHINVANSEMTETGLSTAVIDKETPNGNFENLSSPALSVVQNDSPFDSYTITNGSLQHTGTQEENFTDVQGSTDTSLNDSVANEEHTLDSSSDMEKFAEAIRKLESPITLPQKRKKPRPPKSPGPYRGLPPIREDYLEKILDNEAFSFGLGKKDRAKDLAPMALFKMQSKETTEKLKPKRASTEQSMLLKSLRLKKEPLSVPQETCDKENADVTDVAVKRSRIESIYSDLKSPFATRSEENVFSPSVTTVSTITTSFDTPRKEFTPSGKTCDLKTTDSVKTAHISLKEGKGAFTLPSPEFLLSECAEQPLPVHSMESNLKDHANGDVPVTLLDSNGHLNTIHSTPETNRTVPLIDSISALENPASSDIFYFKGQEQSIQNVSEEISLKGSEKINPRPGKVVILTEADYGGAVFEVFTDVIDCTSWELSPTIFIKTIRGCWILYELPNYEGRTIALEEGDIEITNPWGAELQDENSPLPVIIGSLRHVVKDYRICQIDLFTDPDGLGVMTSYYDDTEEVQVYGRLQRTCSIKVHCGVWLIYEESGFQGIPFIMEQGEYPDLSFLNIQEAYIGSMRPLKMGSRKVEIPYEPKIVLFEKPMFEGRQVELDKKILAIQDLELPEGDGEEQGLSLNTVGSIRVLSGLWIGYEKPGYEGHQYLLEEGDYEEWKNWGGFSGLLQSLRPILSEFSTPHMVMYSEKDFDEKASNINVLGIISNMEETGFGVKIQSINVLSGVWVAYECPDFTGEQYILEKGMYSNFSDWGAKNYRISSVQPILTEALESPGHFRVELFSEPDFKGQSQLLEDDLSNVEESFTVLSCKVISGRWAAYDQADFSGSLWVLEEGSFPNLCAMGCPDNTVIRSLKTINYEFSDPSVVLYGKENCKGRSVKLSKEITDLQAIGYSPDFQSLEVLGGTWVIYEHENYRGRQLLVSPEKIVHWAQFSGWNKVGSLRPLRQKRLYFKLRNRENGMLMSTNGSLDDIKLLRIQVMEDTGAEDQIWVYHKGVFRCHIAEDCTLVTAGTVITTGSKLGLSLDQSGTNMLWNIGPDGRIYCRSKPNFVLDIKGGSQYDQLHIVLNPFTEGKLSQLWEICVL
ncbi:beta/gamma crystallin domain-containing protein 1 isoform X2 [Dendropsophus ebraccatus]